MHQSQMNVLWTLLWGSCAHVEDSHFIDVRLGPTCLAVVEQGEEEVGREDAQKLSEGARALREVHLEDTLVGQLACIGPRPPAHQMP